MTELSIKILWVYPTITDADMASIRAAKAQMDVDYRVLVKVATLASCGVSGRVLALREAPDFLTAYAMVKNTDNLEGMAEAIYWAVSRVVDNRASTIADRLSELAGKPVTELTMDQLARENISTNLKLHHKDKVPAFR